MLLLTLLVLLLLLGGITGPFLLRSQIACVCPILIERERLNTHITEICEVLAVATRLAAPLLIDISQLRVRQFYVCIYVKSIATKL